MSIRFRIKQGVKIFLQSVILPLIYRFYERGEFDENLIVFADAHHNELPDAMENMYHVVCVTGKMVKTHFLDYETASSIQILRSMVRFMKDYARAHVVFICDYYLPAGSCKKRKETILIQLWHACGALKKFGFDSNEDIPRFYIGNPMKNVSLVTVSSRWCVPVYAKAMGLPENRIKALGISRTDRYFDPLYNLACKEKFFRHYPQAKGKKIVLWAPTFRGNAAEPRLVGYKEIKQLEQDLGEDWYVVRKLHPHLEGKAGQSNCNLKTEELLPLCDVMITDFSSVLFDYMIYRKPLVLYAPDEIIYNRNRGLYIDYNSIPGTHVTDEAELAEAIQRAVYNEEEGQLFLNTYMSACDGHATSRILKKILDSKQEV